jgi:sporulation protein YlmC with PRC-barrel domain
MPITVKDISEMFDKDVFTNKGYYAGRVKDLEFDLARFKIRSLVIEAARDSVLSRMIGGKKGVIVPYPVVEAVGDIVIIKHIIPSTAVPTEGEVTAEEAGIEKL